MARDINPVLIVWRTLFTRDPQAGELWQSRYHPTLTAQVRAVDSRRKVMAEAVDIADEYEPWTVRQHISEFVCFWKPLRKE